MNVQELYNYITSQITPEAALMKMLEASIVNYDKLKFAEGEEIHPEILIFMAANDRGWNIAFQAENSEDENSEVPGIMVGTHEYIDKMLNGLDNKLYAFMADTTGPESFFVMSDSREHAEDSIKAISEEARKEFEFHYNKYQVTVLDVNKPIWVENC